MLQKCRWVVCNIFISHSKRNHVKKRKTSPTPSGLFLLISSKGINLVQTAQSFQGLGVSHPHCAVAHAKMVMVRHPKRGRENTKQHMDELMLAIPPSPLTFLENMAVQNSYGSFTTFLQNPHGLTHSSDTQSTSCCLGYPNAPVQTVLSPQVL